MPHNEAPNDRTAARALPRLSMKRAARLGAAIALTSLIGLPAHADGARLTILHEFAGPDGKAPIGNLLLDTNSVIYGETALGGTDKLGVVYTLAPPTKPGGAWTQTVLHAFAGGAADGAHPVSNIVFDSYGAVYGATQEGGAHGAGAAASTS